MTTPPDPQAISKIRLDSLTSDININTDPVSLPLDALTINARHGDTLTIDHSDQQNEWMKRHTAHCAVWGGEFDQRRYNEMYNIQTLRYTLSMIMKGAVYRKLAGGTDIIELDELNNGDDYAWRFRSTIPWVTFNFHETESLNVEVINNERGAPATNPQTFTIPPMTAYLFAFVYVTCASYYCEEPDPGGYPCNGYNDGTFFHSDNRTITHLGTFTLPETQDMTVNP